MFSISGGHTDRAILAVSPHLDDAVLSAGATLAALTEAGHRVVVCTVFAGDPPVPLTPAAEAFHRHCGLDMDAVNMRRHEDRAALQLLSCEALHLEFPDGIYRRIDGKPLSHRPGALFEPNAPDEPELRSEVRATLVGLLEYLNPPLILTCAAIGHHIDHRLTRDSVVSACHATDRSPLLWVDLPYAIGESFRRATIDTTLIELDNRHLDKKLLAVRKYRSQLRVLFPDELNWPARSHRYGRLLLQAPELLRPAPRRISDVPTPR